MSFMLLLLVCIIIGIQIVRIELAHSYYAEWYEMKASVM